MTTATPKVTALLLPPYTSPSSSQLENYEDTLPLVLTKHWGNNAVLNNPVLDAQKYFKQHDCVGVQRTFPQDNVNNFQRLCMIKQHKEVSGR